MLTRARRRTLSFGLQTVLGLRQRGYFIPMARASASASWSRRPYEALMPLFAAAEPQFAAVLAAIEERADRLTAIAGPPPEPRFEQSWFPRLDAAALYTMVQTLAPPRIVEVGSGHSTRFVARALADAGLVSHVTAIDPQPRADLTGLPIALVRSTVQEAGLTPFAALAPGDLVVVDSSHVMMPGTDVDLILNRVLPRLPAGVVVMLHDVFLPDPYPDAWPFTAYNEQNAVAPLLSGRARLLFASHYVVRQMADALAGGWVSRQTLAPGARESALFIKIT